MKKLFIILIAGFISMTGAQAQFGCSFQPSTGEWVAADGGPCVNTIITAVPFLRIVPDARSGGMGDVGLAISADPNAMHFNASKLAFAEKDFALSATYTPWLRALGLTDVYMAYLSGYKQLDEFQAVGFSLRYFSLGTISFTDINGESLGTGRPNEVELAAAYSRKLSEKFAAALTLKYIHSNLASGQQIDNIEIMPANAGAADISLTYKTPVEFTEKDSDLMVGLALTNLGTKVSYTNSINKDFMPANLGLGAAWTINFDQFNAITFAADVNKLLVPTPCVGQDCDEDGNGILDYKEQGVVSSIFSSFSDAPNGGSEELRELAFSVGAEYWYDQQFAVRLGYYYEDATKGNRKFFTVGLGLKYNIFGLNFSYLIPTTNQRNPLDNTLRFSLLFDFAAFGGDGAQ